MCKDPEVMVQGRSGTQRKGVKQINGGQVPRHLCKLKGS